MLKVYLLLTMALPARAWDDHASLTKTALAALPELFEAHAPAETLADFLSATGIAESEAAFLRQIEINPATKLEFKAGEEPGKIVTLSKVLSAYADEPDRGMDQEVFAAYPHLWRDEYVFMGGRTGFTSQSFRHMHWPAGFFKLPPSGGLPVFDPRPLGVAHERAKVYFALSRQAFRAGRGYWGARFAAWGLHYLQDVTQPYHAEQLPAQGFIHRTPSGVDARATGNLIAYYHFAFEALGARLFSSEQGAALRAAAAAGGILPRTADAASLVVELSKSSRAKAPEAGAASLELFPEVADPATFDPGARLRSPEFWAEVQRNIEARPEAFGKYLGVLGRSFSEAGIASRAFVQEAMKRALPPAPARAPALSRPLPLALGF